MGWRYPIKRLLIQRPSVMFFGSVLPDIRLRLDPGPTTSITGCMQKSAMTNYIFEYPEHFQGNFFPR